MAVTEEVSAYSTTAASNTPLGTASVGPDLDNHLRDIKKNIRAAAASFRGSSDGNFDGALKVDDSASPTWTLSIWGNGQAIKLVDVDVSAGTSLAYLGADTPGTFAQEHLPESTASARTTILGGLLGLVAGEATTASASHRLAAVGIGPPIGAVQDTIEATAPDGWLPLAAETLGNLSASATYAGGIYEILYGKLWNNSTDSEVPVEGGRGASAAADWAANKYLTLPDSRGRVHIGTGAGGLDASGSPTLTSRTNLDSGGSEELATHIHSIATRIVGAPSGTNNNLEVLSLTGADAPGTLSSHDTETAGASASGNMPPWIAFHKIIKF